MSLSPFQSGTQQPTPSGNAKNGNAKNNVPTSDRLSLSQALLITAGLAGLVGLFCGVVIRFSLSKSSTARFLSPLQTFPALSDWAPELPQGTADSHYLPGGGEAQNSIRTAPSSGDSQPRQFDSFAGPEEAVDTELRNPAESLPVQQPFTNAPSSENTSGYAERNSLDGSYAEEPYPEESYPEVPYTAPDEAPYVDEAYPAEPYPESYPESGAETGPSQDAYPEPSLEEEGPEPEASYYEESF